MTGRIHVLECFIVAVAILAGSPLLGQSPTQTAAPPPPGADARTRTTLLPQTAVSANTHIELDLRSGDYEVRPSHTGDLGVIELRDTQSVTHAAVHPAGAPRLAEDRSTVRQPQPARYP